MRKLALELAAWTVIAMIAVGPGLWITAGAVPGGEWTDVWNSLWSMHFAAESVSAGTLPWFSDSLNHPVGGSVLLPDALGSLFAVFAVPAVGLASAYSAWITLQLALSGWVMHRFAYAWLRESLDDEHAARAGWVAGLAYCSAPVLLAGATCGTTEAVAGAPPVLAAWAAWRALKHPSWGMTLAAGAAMLVAALSSWYAAVIAAVFVVILTLMSVRSLGVRAVGPLFCGLAMVIPLALWTHAIHTDAAHLATRDPAILDTIRASFGAASALGMIWPIDIADIAIQRSTDAGQGYLHTGYVGIALLIASAVAVFRHPRQTMPWLLSGIACAVLALGPGAEGTRPYGWVDDFPGFRNLSLVWRLAGGTSIAVALIAAAATRGHRRACWILAGAIALEWAWVSPTAGGIATANAGSSVVLDRLAEQPHGAVVTIPPSAAHADLWRQTQHGHPITGTINSRYSTDAAAWISSAEETEWPALQSAAQAQGIRYVLMHQSRELRSGDARFVAQALQKNARVIEQEGRWTAYAVW